MQLSVYVEIATEVAVCMAVMYAASVVKYWNTQSI